MQKKKNFLLCQAGCVSSRQRGFASGLASAHSTRSDSGPRLRRLGQVRPAVPVDGRGRLRGPSGPGGPRGPSLVCWLWGRAMKATWRCPNKYRRDLSTPKDSAQASQIHVANEAKVVKRQKGGAQTAEGLGMKQQRQIWARCRAVILIFEPSSGLNNRN